MIRSSSSFLVAFAAVFAVSFYAYGQLGGADGVRIPYSGQLRLDGVAVNGPYDFRFSVHNDDAGGASCDTHEETTIVSEGVFSSIIGPVDESCVRGMDVYVGIEVSDDEAANGYTALPGRQRIYSATSAVSSGSGDFAVEGGLTVAGALTVGGGLGAASGNFSGGLRVNSAFANARGLDVRWNRQTGTGETDFINYREGGSTGGFSFYDAANTSTIPGSPLVTIRNNGSVNATGAVNAGGDVNATGDVTSTGNTWSGTSESVGVSIPAVDFADNTSGHVLTTCPNGKYVAGIWTKHYQESSNFRDRYVTTLYCAGL